VRNRASKLAHHREQLLHPRQYRAHLVPGFTPGFDKERFLQIDQQQSRIAR